MWLALLWYSHYCGGLKQSLQYLRWYACAFFRKKKKNILNDWHPILSIERGRDTHNPYDSFLNKRLKTNAQLFSCIMVLLQGGKLNPFTTHHNSLMLTDTVSLCGIRCNLVSWVLFSWQRTGGWRLFKWISSDASLELLSGIIMLNSKGLIL